MVFFQICFFILGESLKKYFVMEVYLYITLIILTYTVPQK